MKKIFLLTHLGCGDFVICNGMIRVMASKVDELLLVAKKRYRPAMTSMFGDLKNVAIEYVNEAPDISPAFNGGVAPPLFQSVIGRGYTCIPLGLHSGNPDWQINEPNFARAFYNQVGLDYQCSWFNFKFQRNIQKEQHMYNTVVKLYGKDYAFLHDDPSRSFKIDRSSIQIPTVHPDDSLIRSDNIFDYYMVMQNAKELHFFDSCFGLIIDRMHCVTEKKFCYVSGFRPVPEGFYRDQNILYV
jgi:hypothetical protein